MLVDLIGHGGVSVVYRGLDTVRGRQTAIKLLDPTHAGNDRAREQIVREAMITDRVHHPGVPRIYEYGEVPLGDGTVVPYVAMELISGTLLATQLGGEALVWHDAVRIAAAIADVLTAVHKRGIVHRDLNATNIMMTAQGPKIIDFGVAVTVQTPEQGSGPYVLTPPHPPSNDFAGPGQPADDVYALGVLFYEMLTGRSPYPNEERPPSASTGVLPWLAPTPVLTVAGLPQAVAEICRRLMAKRPGDRADAAAAALDLWATIVHTPEALYQSASALITTATQRGPALAGPAHPRALPAGPTSPPPATPARASRPATSLSTRRTVDLGRRRRRPAWSGPTTGQNAVVRPR